MCALLFGTQVIDVADSRVAKTQRIALREGRSTHLTWRYDKDDQLIGAYCDGTWFDREELMSYSILLPSQ